jgi:lipoate-protein ligase A
MTLPVFGFVAVHELPLVDGIAREAEWLRQVAESRHAAAHLWHGLDGFVVPRSYERLPRWAEACAASAEAAWPVQVRTSGGGLVPQGPGLWNLSLAWPTPAATPIATESVYRSLTDELAAAFSRLGIVAAAQPVEGSFCDGRFNLAVKGRKCVGTAQAWRRIEGHPVVLAHAVVVATADPVAVTDAANRFEAAAGASRRYRAQASTSLAEAWRDAHPRVALPDDFERQVIDAIAERFARIVPPRTTRQE